VGCALHTPIHTYTVLCYVSTPTSSFHKLTLTELCTNNPFSYNLASYDRAGLMQTIFKRIPLVRFYCAKTEDIFWERRGFAWVISYMRDWMHGVGGMGTEKRGSGMMPLWGRGIFRKVPSHELGLCYTVMWYMRK
jgi:hypothetical protein